MIPLVPIAPIPLTPSEILLIIAIGIIVGGAVVMSMIVRILISLIELTRRS